MTKTKVTALEKAVLNHVALNLYQPTNGAKPEKFEDTTDIWSGLILDSAAPEPVKTRSLPGIVASLSKKGLVRVYNGKDGSNAAGQDPSTLGLTETGFNIWKENS